jgi:putative Mg2+ transporter-C (MgtC) family protein
LAVGGGLYVEAVAATVVILVILAGIKPLEERFQQRKRSHEIRLKVDRGQLSIAALDAALGYRARRITRYVSAPSEDPSFDEIAITLTRLSADDIETVIRELRALSSVHDVSQPSI